MSWFHHVIEEIGDDKGVDVLSKLCDGCGEPNDLCLYVVFCYRDSAVDNGFIDLDFSGHDLLKLNWIPVSRNSI